MSYLDAAREVAARTAALERARARREARPAEVAAHGSEEGR
jgi:hypothetical protein